MKSLCVVIGLTLMFCGMSLAQPANDLCSNATFLSVPTMPIPGTTVGATLDNAPFCDVPQTAPGVWYRIIGNGDSLTASTCFGFADFDTRLTVYCGDCSNLACVVGNDDGCGSYPTRSMVRWGSEAGLPYWILVHGDSNATGNYYLNVYDLWVPSPIPTPCQTVPLGRCCYGDPFAPSCADVTLAACQTLGGTWDPSLSCTFYPCPVISSGFSDPFTTPCGGSTHQDFAGTPLPPDFFGPGSDPFAGDVVFRGSPLSTTPPNVLGPTDVVVQRMAPLNVPNPGDTQIIPIEIVALSLVSVSPITVTYYGGSYSEQWDVSVHLSPFSQQQGSITVRRDCEEGGVFICRLPVQPLFHFYEFLGPPGHPPIVFDTHGTLPPTEFHSEGNWMDHDPGFGIVRVPPGVTVDHDGDPATPEIPIGPSDNFFPGLRWDPCGCDPWAFDPGQPPTGTPRKRLTLEESQLASHGILPAEPQESDQDQDCIPDVADNCLNLYNPLQEDQDNDGVGDLCDNCSEVYNPSQLDADLDGYGDICQGGWDQGDLAACNYPTLPNNPGHLVSNIAWLGSSGSGSDDGVVFNDLPWSPCQNVSVVVTVSGGPWYPLYQMQCGGSLYLNAWKDGDLDGDFCDYLCDGLTSEWIIQDQPVTPGAWTFNFMNPGISAGDFNRPFRFRLTSQPVGAEGFGKVSTDCPTMTCGTYDMDNLGEVEDYVLAPCADYSLFAPGGLSDITTGAGDNCTLNPGEELMVQVHIPYTGMWSFSLCHPWTNYDSWLDLYSECCGGTLIASDDNFCGLQSQLNHVPLDAGTYYLAIEGSGMNTGRWELTVSACRQRVDFDPQARQQSICVTLDNAEHTDFVIGGQPGQPPLDPALPPIVSIVPGCDPALTNCNDPDCPPYAEVIELVWIFVPDSVIMCDCGFPGCNCPPVIIQGGWYAVYMNTGHWVGCVCVTFEGFQPPCNPVTDLVIRYSYSASALWLYWTAPQQANYLIYSAVNPNNNGNPPGPGWVLEVVLALPPGPAQWQAPSGIAALYKNYVIVADCQPANGPGR